MKFEGFYVMNLYKEFDLIIPKNLCISIKNTTKKIREENYQKVFSLIQKFFNQNKDYKNCLLKLYTKNEFDKNFYEDILIGYVFFIACSMPNEERFDIFKNKTSICFAPISIVDML